MTGCPPAPAPPPSPPPQTRRRWGALGLRTHAWGLDSLWDLCVTNLWCDHQISRETRRPAHKQAANHQLERVPRFLSSCFHAHKICGWCGALVCTAAESYLDKNICLKNVSLSSHWWVSSLRVKTFQRGVKKTLLMLWESFPCWMKSSLYFVVILITRIYRCDVNWSPDLILKTFCGAFNDFFFLLLRKSLH